MQFTVKLIHWFHNLFYYFSRMPIFIMLCRLKNSTLCKNFKSCLFSLNIESVIRNKNILKAYWITIPLSYLRKFIIIPSYHLICKSSSTSPLLPQVNVCSLFFGNPDQSGVSTFNCIFLTLFNVFEYWHQSNLTRFRNM